MEQVKQFIDGERDYTKIKGGTGPLVYPAAHVYIYWVLYKITDQGRNILLAQRVFGVLYLGTLAVVMACYKRAKVFISLFSISRNMAMLCLGAGRADSLCTGTALCSSPSNSLQTTS